MPQPKTGVTYFHVQLGLPDKGRAIVCVEWLGYVKGVCLWTTEEHGSGPLLWSGMMAIELKYHNTPQKHSLSRFEFFFLPK